jgi:hypothetical protein
VQNLLQVLPRGAPRLDEQRAADYILVPEDLKVLWRAFAQESSHFLQHRIC